jgi:hypothetical protein
MFVVLTKSSIMKNTLVLFLVVLLTGCSNIGRSPFGQALHGDRVSKESDSTLCLRYLAGGGGLSNRVREAEIADRKLNCASVVSVKDVELERRILRAEEAADRAEQAAGDAERKARDAEQKASRSQLCAKGMKGFCY